MTTTIAPVLPATTVDAILDGAVVLEQPAHGQGYRVNADAIVLARFAARAHPHIDHLVDVGAGVGAVALCVNQLATVHAITLIDANPAACELARRNVLRAGAAERTRVMESPVSSIASLAPPAHVVVCNPPYTPPGSGRASPCAAVQSARHGELEPFLQLMRRLLAGAEACACLCYPAAALTSVLQHAQRLQLHAQRMQFVHPSQDRPATIVMFELSAGPPGNLVLETPWMGPLR